MDNLLYLLGTGIAPHQRARGLSQLVTSCCLKNLKAATKTTTRGGAAAEVCLLCYQQASTVPTVNVLKIMLYVVNVFLE